MGAFARVKPPVRRVRCAIVASDCQSLAIVVAAVGLTPATAAAQNQGAVPGTGPGLDPAPPARRPARSPGILDHPDVHAARTAAAPGRQGVLHGGGMGRSAGPAHRGGGRSTGRERHQHRGRRGTRAAALPGQPRSQLRPLRQRAVAENAGPQGAVDPPHLADHTSARRPHSRHGPRGRGEGGGAGRGAAGRRPLHRARDPAALRALHRLAPQRPPDAAARPTTTSTRFCRRPTTSSSSPS